VPLTVPFVIVDDDCAAAVAVVMGEVIWELKIRRFGWQFSNHRIPNIG
jgi:hypothetical protein